jgi:uncharacterized protein with ParB-like and HNH nuclease domain
VSSFEFKPTTLLAILRNGYLQVPRYQREYAWEDEQVSDFWSDMMNTVKDKQEYFLGTVVLSKEAPQGAKSIVDGQQRMTTTVLLLCALRDSFEANGDERAARGIKEQYISSYDVKIYEEKARLRLNLDDNPFFFDRFILGKPAAPKLPSHRLLEDSYAMLRSKLEEIITKYPSEWKQKFAQITTYLDEQARVVQVDTGTDADAFVIFETLNDRGADLTTADLLKNYLFSQSGANLDIVQALWIEAISTFQGPDKIKTFVQFLRHWWSSKKGLIREIKLYRSIRDDVKDSESALRFAQDLVEASNLYDASTNPDADYWKIFDNDTQAYAEALIRLNLEQNLPLLLSIMQTFPKAHMRETLRRLLAWSVRSLVAGLSGGGKAERYYCDAAKAVREKKIETADKLYLELDQFVPADSQFRSTFSTYTTNKSSLARYLLLSLEKDMRSEKEPEMVPNEEADQVNLEHILPQRAKDADWPQFSVDDRKAFALRLGNMTLLKKTENNKIGNKGWVKKKPVLSASILRLNQDMSKIDLWRTDHISARQQDMADRAVTIWPA